MSRKLSVEQVNLSLSKYNICIVGEYMGRNYTTKFKCHCGNIFYTKPQSIFTGHTQSCGCFKYKRRLIDLTNSVFGRLKVIKLLPRTKNFREYLCVCECGNFKNVSSVCLREGRTKSCGCLQSESSLNTLNKFGLCKKGVDSIHYNHNLTNEDRIMDKVERAAYALLVGFARRLKQDNKPIQILEKVQICPDYGIFRQRRFGFFGFYQDGEYSIGKSIDWLIGDTKDCHKNSSVYSLCETNYFRFLDVFANYDKYNLDISDAELDKLLEGFDD